MEKEQGEFQTRDEAGYLNYFDTFGEAYDAAKKDSSIWKISFTAGSDRIRLVRAGGNKPFVLEQFRDMLERILSKEENNQNK